MGNLPLIQAIYLKVHGFCRVLADQGALDLLRFASHARENIRQGRYYAHRVNR